MPGDAVTLAKDGRAISVSREDAASLLANGWTPETGEQQHAREESELVAERDPGATTAAILGAFRGLTFGGSDALVSALGGGAELRDIRERHPIASTVGAIGGALVPSLVAPGAGSEGLLGDLGTLAAKTPVGAVARAGSKIAELGKDAGVVGKALASTGAGVVEGAAASAGAYVTDVALGDKELSADAFVGSLGGGALWGGGLSGALSVGASGLAAARKMFARSELTKEGVERASRAATTELSSAATDADAVKAAARSRLTELREQRAAMDLDFAERLQAQQLRKATADADRAEASLSRAKGGPRRAFSGDEIPDPAAIAKHEAATDTALEQTLPASAIAKRGYREPPGAGEDAVRVGNARQAIKEGQREPVKLSVSPEGEITVTDGRHRLAAAIEADAPIKVRWSSGEAPAGTDVARGARAASSLDDEIRAAIKAGKVEGEVGPFTDRGLDLAVAREAKRRGAASAASVGAPAAPAAPAARAASSLEQQLAGTKQALDAGADLGELSRAMRRSIVPAGERAANAELAKVEPEADRLMRALDELEDSHVELDRWLAKHGGGSVARFERGEAARSAAADMRPKEAGFYRQTPTGEGTAAVPRGRESVFRGDLADRQLAEARTIGKLAPEEQIAADDAVARMFGPRPSIDAQLADALGARTPAAETPAEIHEAARVVGRFEAAHADAVDAVGAAAPSAARARADGFREAQRGAEDATASATAQRAEHAERAADTIRLGGDPVASVGKGKIAGALDIAKQAGTAAEALRMLGLDVPDPSSIPVVGPLLSLYLKARVLGKALGRRLGGVPETAEHVVASRAATTRDAALAAVDRMLGAGEKAVRAVAPAAAIPAAILSHKLFDDGTPAPRRAPTPGPETVHQEDQRRYLARADEINQALQPGALEREIRSRIGISDPRLIEAITQTMRRKFEYLDATLWKPDAPSMVPGNAPAPPRAEIAKLALRVRATEHPADVLSRAADGALVAAEEIEALHAVYPSLLADAQRRLVQRIADGATKMTHAARVQASRIFGLPLDGSMSPEGASFLRATHAPVAPPPSVGAAPSKPTVTSDVQFDRRADPATKGS